MSQSAIVRVGNCHSRKMSWSAIVKSAKDSLTIGRQMSWSANVMVCICQIGKCWSGNVGLQMSGRRTSVRRLTWGHFVALWARVHHPKYGVPSPNSTQHFITNSWTWTSCIALIPVDTRENKPIEFGDTLWQSLYWLCLPYIMVVKIDCQILVI